MEWHAKEELLLELHATNAEDMKIIIKMVMPAIFTLKICRTSDVLEILPILIASARSPF